jgi:hypothetical protein
MEIAFRMTTVNKYAHDELVIALHYALQVGEEKLKELNNPLSVILEEIRDNFPIVECE